MVRSIALLLATTGCIAVTVPPQSPMGPYVPLGPPDEISGSLTGDIALWPALTGNVQLPIDIGAVELGGQLATTSYAATPALWVRDAEGGDVTRAYRIGLSAGAGDLLGIYPFQMPYFAGSFHFQTQRPKPKHIATTTIGVSLAVPLSVGDDVETSTFIVILYPSSYLNARWSWAWPVAGGDHFVLSAGFDIEIGLVGLSLLVTPIIPAPALGLAWQFGKPEQRPPPPVDVADPAPPAAAPGD